MLCVNVVLHLIVFYTINYGESPLTTDSIYVSKFPLASASFPGQSDRKCSLRDISTKIGLPKYHLPSVVPSKVNFISEHEVQRHIQGFLCRNLYV
jgi:hypothetical protein